MVFTSERVLKELQQIINQDLCSGASIINLFLTEKIEGSWQRWLELEFARRVFESPGESSISYKLQSGLQYPNAPGECALAFQLVIKSTLRPNRAWMALKVQDKPDGSDTLKEFFADIQSIQSQGLQFLRQETPFALAFFKLTIPDVIKIKESRNSFAKVQYYCLMPAESSEQNPKIFQWQNVTDDLYAADLKHPGSDDNNTTGGKKVELPYYNKYTISCCYMGI